MARIVGVDIPNNKTGIMHHYRAAFNGDFSEFIKTATTTSFRGL